MIGIGLPTKTNLYFFIACCFGALILFSCQKEGCTDVTASNYKEDAKKDDGSCVYTSSDAMLKQLLDNVGYGIIVPRYSLLVGKVNELDNAVVAFSTTTNEANLAMVQEALEEASIAWQKCSTFEFGPAETKSLRTHVNTFPTDTTAIEEKIAANDYDLSSFLAVAYKGLPAIDYLVHNGNDASIVNAFELSSNRMGFLTALVTSLKEDVEFVYTSWIAEEGNYVNTFVNSTGSDISSSLSLLVNQFNYDYELVKNAKVGIPLGKRTLGDPLPEQAEAFYGGISSALAQASVQGLYNLYLGVNEDGEDKTGFDDFLVAGSNQQLSSDIQTQFEIMIAALQNVPDPMAETIVNNSSVVDLAYEELKKLVILIKTNMSAEMEVSITYSDGDGD